jgi:hypothetical protein
MFSGFQELLLIGLIIVGILILPRMIKPQQPAPRKITPRRSGPELVWTLRLFIVLSILWPLCWALYFKPWHQHNRIPFIIVGTAPVIVGWCIKWILAGMKNKY